MRDYGRGGALTETTFLILLALYQPKHGYGIMQFIESRTHGRVCLGAGTLYGALNTMKQKEWIEELKDRGARRKEYRITSLGRNIAEAELFRMKQVLKTAELIMGVGK